MGNKVTLNHTLAFNDGYGDYESIIASQTNSSGTKKLVLVTIVSTISVATYFKVLKNTNIVEHTTSFERAKNTYNITN